jgi:hypothetical protein
MISGSKDIRPDIINPLMQHHIPEQRNPQPNERQTSQLTTTIFICHSSHYTLMCFSVIIHLQAPVKFLHLVDSILFASSEACMPENSKDMLTAA